MSQFQYQQLVEPSIVSVDVPSVASWMPTAPNNVLADDDGSVITASKRRSGGHGRGGGGGGGGGGGPVLPPTPPVVPTYAAGIFPDTVPRLGSPLLPDLILLQPPAASGIEFWTPSFPDRLAVFPPFLPGLGGVGPFEPVVPSLSRAIPEGPTFAVWERTSGRYRGQLVKGDLVTPLPGSLLTSLTLTLYMIDASDADQIINGRNKQNVLNQNGVSISTGGEITWEWSAADTALVSSAPFERHLALFEWTWPNGAGKREVILVVKNLRRVS